MEKRVLLDIVKEICKEEKIELKDYSKGYIIQLKKDDRVEYIYGYSFNLNKDATSRIMCDKSISYEVLKNANIPAVEHEIVFNPITRLNYNTYGVWEKIYEYFKRHNQELVIKVNNGTCGKDVYYCNNADTLDKAVLTIFEREDELCICPYYDIKNEYRCIYLDGECLLTYTKNKPKVIGNGKNTIAELISKRKCKVQLDLPLNLNSIPKKDEIVYLNWKFNLSGGATAEILVDKTKKEKIEKLAKEAGKVINARFSSIDIIETRNNEFKIMELNAGIMATNFIAQIPEGYEIMKNIYRKAIIKMFE